MADHGGDGDEHDNDDDDGDGDLHHCRHHQEHRQVTNVEPDDDGDNSLWLPTTMNNHIGW